jgi:isopentenyl diphosphate isomerase/L-lactate dehydrogenase-like FMN-dependent dehydrogenase
MASRRKPAAKVARSRVKTPASKRPLARSLPKEVPSPLESCACVTDLEAVARERLPKGVYDYYAGGAEDEQTVEGNREAFRRVFLRPRALVGVAQVDTATTVLGIPVSLPVLLAPVAYQRMAHPEGEVATARAAASAGTLMVVSTIATASIEEVASAAPPAPRWFQLYMAPEREISEHLIARAEASGYRALCLTVDTPMLGRRERDVRNRFNPGMALANFDGDIAWMPRTQTGSGFAVGASRLLDPSLTWDTVRWMRARTRLPVIVKGVIAAADVEPAIEAGASAIVVSNHGGRQLDGCEPTLAALPHVVEAAAGRIEIYVDGGVRRGTDVVKALALGARAVLVGRPIVWGLAAGGEKGVAAALEMLRSELAMAMALCGCPTIDAIRRELVTVPWPAPEPVQRA